MRGGNIASPQLPRNSSLLNARLSNQVRRGPSAQGEIQGNAIMQQGRQLSGALDKMGHAFALVAEKVQDDLDETAVKEADNKLSDVIREQLLNPDSGYMTTAGRGTISARGPTVEQINNARDELEKGLANDRQKEAFKSVSMQRIQTSNQTIDKHAFQQVQVYKKAETSARIEAARTDAAANWGSWRELDADGKRIGPFNIHKDVMLSEVEKQAQNNGFQPGTKGYRDEVLNKMLEQTTSLHTQVIQNMVSFGQTNEAKEYFNEAIKRGEVHPDSLDAANNLINTGAVKNDSLRLSFSLEGSLSQKQKDLKKMFNAGEIDADVYDATLSRVSAMDSQAKAMQEEYKKDALVESEAWLVDNPGNTWVDLPARLQQRLKDTGQVDTIAAFSNNGGFKHNMGEWMEFQSLPADELASMTPTTFYNRFRGKFDNAHMEKGAAMVGPRNGKDKNQNKLITIQERVKRAAQGANILPFDGKASESQQIAYGRFEGAVQDRLNEFTENNDRDPKPDEMQNIIDNILLDEVKVPSWFTDKSQSVHTLDPETLNSVYVEVDGEEVKMAEIPPNKMAEYTQIIIDKNRPVTQELLARMWLLDRG